MWLGGKELGIGCCTFRPPQLGSRFAEDDAAHIRRAWLLPEGGGLIQYREIFLVDREIHEVPGAALAGTGRRCHYGAWMWCVTGSRT